MSLTVKDVAAEVKASVDVVRDAIRAGELEAWEPGKPGQGFRIEPDALERWKKRKQVAERGVGFTGLRALEGKAK